MNVAAYPPHQNQLQHAAVSQAPQPIQNGHPGQPTPHAMGHLHPGPTAFQHQQMQALANSMNNPQLYQQQRQQQLLRQQQQQMLLAANGLSGAGNPGVPGNPQNPGMGAFAGPPQMRGQMMPHHMQQHLQVQAAQAAQQQAQLHQQQQQIVAAQAAQQLALANQGVNVQAAAQNMSMPQQQVTIPANAGGPSQQQVNMAAAAHAAAVARAQQHQQNKPSGQAVLKMHHFNTILSQYEKDKTLNSMGYWRKFVHDFFSPTGLMRQALLHHTSLESKHFEIGNAILPRYFWELIESGVNSVQFQLEGLRERELPNGQGMVVECPRAALVYTYKDAVCFHHGSLKATLNTALSIEVLEFTVTKHQEFVSRSTLQAISNPSESPDVKASPRSKQMGKRPLPQEQPVQSFTLPDSHTNHYGLHPMVLRFLEAAETMSCLGELMFFSRQNPTLTPRESLNALVTQYQTQQQMQQQQMVQQQQAVTAAIANAQGMQNAQQGHPGGPNGGAGGPHMHSNSPHMGMPGMAGSPAIVEGRLVAASPHIGQTPSPANQLQAPGQQPQQHPISNSSSQNSTTVGSANTSPNQPNKRRRPSTSQNVKNEAEDGAETKSNGPSNLTVKPSPRMANNKRIKTANPS